MSKRHPKFADLPDPVPAKQVEPVVAKPDLPKPPPQPEPVKRNIFGQVIKPVVGGIGSGSAK